MSSSVRVVLITGSTSGIGLEMAKRFAEGQYEVILNGFGTKEQIENIQTELKQLNGKEAMYVGADLTKVSEINQLVEEIMEKCPAGLDVLVNNAGLFRGGDSQNATEEDFDLSMNLMVKAPFLLCKAFIPSMKAKAKGKEHGGRIINTISVAGLQICGTPHSIVYAAAKHALMGLTKSIAVEVAGYNMTCNGICPGDIDTASVHAAMKQLATLAGITTDEMEAAYKGKEHTGTGFMDPKYIANVAWFLCSPEAKYMTGSPVVVDGGILI